MNWQELIEKYKWQLSFLLVGISFAGVGILALTGVFAPSPKVKILESESSKNSGPSEIVVEIAGSVQTPGVYRFENGARIDDLLVSAGGVSADADREWMEKFLNRAAKVSDGQKIYIPSVNDHSDNASANFSGGNSPVLGSQNSTQTNTININTASASELDTLPGIGPVYAQKIVDHRPYSNIEELQSKNIIPSSTYEKIKDSVSVY